MKRLDDIRIMHINEMDLNLLRLFDAVYRQGNVSRAAAELNLTQPAASQGLMRLRRLLADPLFERAAGGVKPTPKAARLADAVRQAMALLEGAFNEATAFDPAQSRRTFRLHMSDIGEGRFLPDLMQALNQSAPGVRVETASVPPAELAQAMDAGRVDFAFGFLPNLQGAGLARAQLLQDRYCVLLRQGHPFLEKPPAQAQGADDLLGSLRELEFVAVRSHSDTLRILQWLQLEDRIRLTTEHFTVLPSIVRATDLAVVMPRAIALGFDTGYAVVDAPLPLRDFSVSLHWSKRFEAESAHQWLRGLIMDSFGDAVHDQLDLAPELG